MRDWFAVDCIVSHAVGSLQANSLFQLRGGVVLIRRVENIPRLASELRKRSAIW
jgi:hypothetical protein